MDMSLTEIAQHVVRRLKLDGLVDEIDCRLVAYDKQNECISRSFDSGDVTYQEAITPMFYTDWMLQIREPGERSGNKNVVSASYGPLAILKHFCPRMLVARVTGLKYC